MSIPGHITWKMTVRFPPQTPTIEAKIHWIFGQFVNFTLQKIVLGRPIPGGACTNNLCHSLTFVKFSEASPFSTRDMSVRKSWFWVGRNYGAVVLHLWTKVHQIKFACVGVIVVCNTVFRLLISCCTPKTFAIQSRSCPKLRRKSDIFGPPNF